MNFRFFSVFLLSAYSFGAWSQNFYNTDTIQKIEIFFEESDWDYKLDLLKLTTDDYLIAKSVIINGVKFDSAGVKYKGNSSFDTSNKKNSLHIELNNQKKQDYLGFTDIKLNNGYADPSMIREVLGYNILNKYMDSPKSNFAIVYINGRYYGVFANSESINKKFVKDKFLSSNNTFIKCNPIITPGPNVKSNLKYINSDSNSYFNYYELKSKRGWNNLVNFCDTLSNFPSKISTMLDLDRAIWMIAFNNLLINLDSYNGVFAQNYYLYKDYTNRFNPIIWDLNMALGAFPFAGSPGNGMGTLSNVQMQLFQPDFHKNHIDWPLINLVFSNSIYRKKYYAHYKTILNENFGNNAYLSNASKYRNLIDSFVKKDSLKFYSYNDFLNSNTNEVNIGTYKVQGIKTLMDSRTNYLNSVSEITNSQPEISQIKITPEVPVYNTQISINAKVTNVKSDSVWLEYRFSQTDKFKELKMYDDGNHNDVAASDNVFGVNLTMNSANFQYYIYAENANAARFSPERAEHEFYNISIPTDTVKKGDVVINEFLAINDKSDINEYGIYTDWIELHNTTSKTLDLSGFLLSDNIEKKGKFTFASNTFIYPKSFLIIWADGLKTTTKAIHAEFSLSGSGGQVILCKIDSTIIDSITYTEQTTDISTGRCPDGNGKFIEIETPSFAGSNNIVCKAFGINSFENKSSCYLYPNPAGKRVEIITFNLNCKYIELYNNLGQLISNFKFENSKIMISTEKINNGIYYYKIYDNNSILKKVGKFLISK